RESLPRHLSRHLSGEGLSQLELVLGECCSDGEYLAFRTTALSIGEDSTIQIESHHNRLNHCVADLCAVVVVDHQPKVLRPCRFEIARDLLLGLEILHRQSGAKQWSQSGSSPIGVAVAGPFRVRSGPQAVSAREGWLQ